MAESIPRRSGAHHPDTRDPRSRAGVLLASQSPRRRRLFSWLELPFASTAVDTPEELDTPLAADPAALAAHLAAEKAGAVRAHGLGIDDLVLTFDTIVVHEGAVLGKPVDVDDAWRMLRSLSGRSHEVVTGVALLAPADIDPRTFSVTTEVVMRTLTDRRIEEWMARGEFMGCAGAYNIEGQVAEVADDECYHNVAGLPLCHVCAAIASDADTVAAAGGVPTSPIARCDTALSRSCKLGPRVVRAASAR